MEVRTYRKIHRWLGLVVGIQLLLWTAGGLFFSLNPIAKVRGETEEPESPPLEFGTLPASPAPALSELRLDHPQAEIRNVLLRHHLDSAIYEITFLEDGEPHWALVDASTGELRATVDRDEAEAIARRAYIPDSPIEDVTLVTEAGSGSEYRERPLPAFRVTFDDPLGTRLYVSVEHGLVTARRNDRWRLFDFLWMLHIMDYQNRDNFNTLLLQAVSALGLVTVLSGFTLAAVTSPRMRRLFGRI
jgi:uncharacterized iron-regulated membrane protein